MSHLFILHVFFLAKGPPLCHTCSYTWIYELRVPHYVTLARTLKHKNLPHLWHGHFPFHIYYTVYKTWFHHLCMMTVLKSPTLLQVLMFWIVDSILMHKRKKNGASSSPGIHYHRSSARYNRLKYNIESCSDSDSSEEEVAVYKKGSGHSRGHRQLTSQSVRTQPLAGPQGSVDRDTDTRLDSTEL